MARSIALLLVGISERKKDNLLELKNITNQLGGAKQRRGEQKPIVVAEELKINRSHHKKNQKPSCTLLHRRRTIIHPLRVYQGSSAAKCNVISAGEPFLKNCRIFTHLQLRSGGQETKMLDLEAKAKIRRLYDVEGWKVGTIAKELGIHHSTVKRALEEKLKESSPQKSVATSIGAYEDFIGQIMKDHPTLSATRVKQMIEQRGYRGSIYPVRRILKILRPKSSRAYQDISWFPGEAAQVDWADFGRIEVAPGSWRRIQLFAAVLCHSRSFFGWFFHDQKTSALLEGHIRAFNHWGGSPRRMIYDNMRTAVKANLGKQVEFTSSLLQLANHYRFEPIACNPRSGWEKGKVENVIRYVRVNFSVESRTYSDLKELNEQLSYWIKNVADMRDLDGSGESVGSAMLKEREFLTPVSDPFEAYEEVTAKVNKKSMVQYDTNLYSIPPKYVNQNLIIRADSEHICVFSEKDLVAKHKRCWEKGKKIASTQHVEQIIEMSKSRSKRQSRALVVKRIPSGDKLLQSWGERHENIGLQSRKLGELIDNYGESNVEAAAQLAFELDTTHVDSIEHILVTHTTPATIAKAHYARKDLDNYQIEQPNLMEYDNL